MLPNLTAITNDNNKLNIKENDSMNKALANNKQVQEYFKVV